MTGAKRAEALARRGRRLLAAVGASVLAAMPLSAAAQPTPASPDEPHVADQWVNPAVRAGQASSDITLDLVEAPALRNGRLIAGADLSLTFEVHNTTSEPVEDLELSVQRSGAVANVGDARTALVADTSDYSFYGPTLNSSISLEPGETRTITASVPTDTAAAASLAINAEGVYPLLFQLSGPQGPITTERFLLSVAPATDTQPAAPAAPAEESEAPGFSMVYPVTAEVDIVPGETGEAPEDPPLILRSEQLAEQMSEGGRLDELTSIYLDATTGEGSAGLNEAACLAIDPAVVDTAERMSGGYTVSDTRPMVETPQRLRNSWGDSEERVSIPGEGADEASAWLTQLRQIAANGCIVALPWANTDINSIAESGDTWLMREALERGPHTLNEVLGTPGLTNTVIAPHGYIDDTTAPAAGWADHSRSTIAERGMDAEWEDALSTRRSGDGSPQSTLDATDLPEPSSTAAPAPQNTVSVLVADNTVPQGNRDSRFAEAAPGINMVTYQDSLAATLAATGPQPLTVGYSNPATRFDYRADSPQSRTITASSALRLSANQANQANQATQTADPILAMAPATLEPSTAGHLLDTARRLLRENAVVPLTLDSYLTPAAEEQPAPLPEGQHLGTPFPDPAVITDAEIQRVRQQARYTDDLTRILANDASIALSRYGFTLPLRQELLQSLSHPFRHALSGYDEAVERTDERLNANRDALQTLRSSVSLIPPGNVYTRTSDSSPLLIVAENRLPLPVNATIEYQAADNVRLNTPDEIRIPARGSITVEMTTDLPADDEQNDIRLWLATPDGSAISTPVDISVQTRAGTTALVALVGALALVMVLALVFRTGRRRRKGPRAGNARAPG